MRQLSFVCRLRLTAAVSLLLIRMGPSASAQTADSIWHSFTRALVRNEITRERIRAYDPSLTEPMLRFLGILRAGVPAEQWERQPEVHTVGKFIHYLLPLSDKDGESTFCFTLTSENGQWYFCHMETISIRLDTVSAFPASTFPDLPNEQKAWMREETYWSEIVKFYSLLVKEKGKQFVLDMFKDGAGYAMAAKAWVPFVPPEKAFVLYLCWEQSVLRGNHVVLERLTDSTAQVTMQPIFFELYRRSGHLNQQISFQNYRQIFETIWENRAQNAGWKLQIDYPNNEDCVLTLRR